MLIYVAKKQSIILEDQFEFYLGGFRVITIENSLSKRDIQSVWKLFQALK